MNECRNFFAELKRRNVYKVAVAYAVFAWLTIRSASIFFTVTAEACIVGIDEHAWRNRSYRGRVAAGTKAGVNAFPRCASARQWGENAGTARLFVRRNRKLDRT